MRDDAEILETLTSLMAADKSLATIPEWQKIGSSHREQLHLVCPLAIDDVVSSGLKLELTTPAAAPGDRKFYGLSAHVFATVKGRTWHLYRIEFDPENRLQIHRNPLGKHGAPPTITGPHFHPFSENANRGLSALTPDGNLPIAFPLNENLVTFRDILRVMSAHLKISGLWLEEPAWLRTLV